MVAAVGQGCGPGSWWTEAGMCSKQPALHRTPPPTPSHHPLEIAIVLQVCGVEGNPVHQGRAHTAEQMDVSAVLRRSLEK